MYNDSNAVHNAISNIITVAYCYQEHDHIIIMY
jgi:hypothetical protein